jgi:anaerobic selenocysteine-containing dehydrogenase
MDLIVDINPKFSFTGTHADYILPAAGWYEKTGIKYTVAYVPYLHYCDAAVPPWANRRTNGKSTGCWRARSKRPRSKMAAGVAGCGPRQRVD